MSKLILRNVRDIIIFTLINIIIVGVIHYLFKFNSITYYKYGLYFASSIYLIAFLFVITSGVGHNNVYCADKATILGNSNSKNPKGSQIKFNYKLFNVEIKMVLIFAVTALIGLAI